LPAIINKIFMMIKFVYFDIGGVVISDLTANNGWAKMKKDMGVTPEMNAEFEEFFTKIESEVCLGLDVELLVPLMKDKFGLHFPKNYSFLADFVNRFDPNPSIWPVIDEIKKTCRVGLLTNMYPNMLNAIKKQGLLPKVKWNVIVDSSVEGVRKPSQEVFELAEKKAGFSGKEILFIDNSVKHVNAAKKFGWQTFLYDPTKPKDSSRELLQFFDEVYK
jgi:FMN phosphatase YigB (HAD superfamily)